MGVGEYARSLIVAEAARERWPRATIRFVVDKLNRRFPHDSFEHHLLDGRVSQDMENLNAVLRETAPDVVVFDNTGRTDQIICARKLGIPTVYVASRPKTRERAFRVRRLWRLDQLWIIQHRFGPEAPSVTALERLKRIFAPRTEISFLDAIFPESDADRCQALRRELGLVSEPYALFVAGGGGWKLQGRWVADLFLEAARRVRDAVGIRCVVVMGPLYTDDAPQVPGLTVLPALPPTDLVDLLHDATFVACGGGSVACQAMALGRICIAAPAGGPDQPERIRNYARQGLLAASEMTAEAISSRALELLNQPTSLAETRARLASYGPRNGLPTAVRNLERLL
jgi:hypothetical protein